MAKVEQVYYSEQLTTNELSTLKQKYASGEIEYIVSDCATEDDAITATRKAVEAKKRGMRLVSMTVEERCDETTWRIRASYVYRPTATGGEDEESEVPESTASFDFLSQTKHIDRGLQVVSAFDTTGAIAPPTDTRIGVKMQGDAEVVDGVDIVSAKIELSETHHFTPKKMSTKYRKQLATMVGKVNDAPFRGYEVGEVLFLGASGSRTGKDRDDLWQLTFKFSVSPNEFEYAVEGIVASKLGHEVAWVQEAETINDGRKTSVPKKIVITQVYPLDDFTKLGIGR